MKKLEGKVAIVTGAQSGIGLAIATAFKEHGATVYASDIRADLNRHSPDHVSKLDVTSESGWGEMLEDILSQNGKIDILVNNAGGTSYEGLHDFTIEAWNALTALNQLGPALGMRAVLPSMLERKSGSIINISSIFGARSVSGIAAYHATKAALLNMTRNGAVSYARSGVRVNAILPGHVLTPLTAAQDPKLNAEFIGRTPMGRQAMPFEIAMPAVFLASDDASFITGVELPVDGGYLAV